MEMTEWNEISGILGKRLQTDPRVETVFHAYPDKVKQPMLDLRKLVLTTVKYMDEEVILEETLKWGEPSYLTKHGSTLRMDWKSRSPDQYALYFKCTSKLVPAFKSVYGDRLQYETTRAIIFKIEESIDTDLISRCIEVCLRYHKVKQYPNLGLEPIK